MNAIRYNIKIAFVAVFLLCALCHAKVKVISPVPGEWANRQVLALDAEGASSYGGEVFYSLDGEDPIASGFAYDGPVLLDKTGDVTLRVSVLLKDGKIEPYTINYIVHEANTIKEAFIKNALRTGFVEYTAGGVLSIPQSLHYSIEGGAFEKGRDISLPASCILKRLAQMAIDDGEGNFFSFVLRVMPSIGNTPLSFDVATARKVPFSVRGWEEVRLDDARQIYSVDGGMWLPWTGAGSPITLDRTKPHTISWQSANYKKTNEVSSFTLPPIPHLYTKTGEAGDVSITFGESCADYAVGTVRQGELSLMKEAVLDVVYGDEDEGTFPVRVYCKGVYQGAIAIDYHIDRRRPGAPVIEASVINGSMSREGFDVTVTGEEGARLYVSLDGDGYEEVKSMSGAPKKAFYLDADKEAKRTLSSYSVDECGNASDAIEYNVTIDKYNYVADEEHGKQNALGTADFPLSSIKECLAMSSGDMHITVRGKVGAAGLDINHDCTIEGEGADARLLIDGTLFVSGNVTLKNLIVEGTGGEKEAGARDALIKAEDATLTLNGCEVFSVFDGNGTVIKTEGGALNIQDSGVTGKASHFVCAISGVNTNTSIQNSRISTAAMESTCASLSGSDVLIDKSYLRVSGKRAHAIELFGTKSRITGNTLEADLSDTGGKSIYFDDDNTQVENTANTERGW